LLFQSTIFGSHSSLAGVIPMCGRIRPQVELDRVSIRPNTPAGNCAARRRQMTAVSTAGRIPWSGNRVAARGRAILSCGAGTGVVKAKVREYSTPAFATFFATQLASTDGNEALPGVSDCSRLLLNNWD